MELSISIVSYNTKAHLRECLSSILKNIKDIEYEIIVVDNGSRDGSAEMIKQEFPPVKLIENNKNVFFTMANNQAMRNSEGEYILLLNSDTLILNNTIKDMLHFMEYNPGVGAVSGRILFPDGRIQNMGWKSHTPLDLILNQEPLRSYFRKKNSCRGRPACLPKNNRRTHGFAPTYDSQRPREVDVVSDAFMLVRRDAIFQIGLYDERFLLYYTEDDLCHRLKDVGWEIYHFPQASIIHKLFGSSKKVSAVRIALIGTIDTLKYCAKYYKLPIIMIISFFLLVGFLIEMLKIIAKRITCQE